MENDIAMAKGLVKTGKPENQIDNFKFKTMSARIKIGRGAIDPELLRAMGFNVIVDTSVPKGEIHIKHITVPSKVNSVDIFKGQHHNELT